MCGFGEELLHLEFDVKGDDFTLAGQASSEVKSLLKQIGVNTDIIKRTAIAMYEAEMNMVIHAGGGKVKVCIDDKSIKAVFEDRGPGIANIDLAMKEGYSTAPDSIREMGFGAGMGLPNMKKCSDKMNIESKPGLGTKLEIEVFLA